MMFAWRAGAAWFSTEELSSIPYRQTSCRPTLLLRSSSQVVKLRGDTSCLLIGSTLCLNRHCTPFVHHVSIQRAIALAGAIA